MASYNRVIVAGNLTRDPELKKLPSGSTVADLGLAVNRTWFDKASETKKEEVNYFNVTLFGRTAEVAGEYLKKASGVLIEGRLKMDEWSDKETGKKRTALKIIGENMQMLGSRAGAERPAQQPSARIDTAAPQDVSEEDVPF